MRATRTLSATLAAALLAAAPARAGVYNTAEQETWPLSVENFSAFQFRLGDLRGIASDDARNKSDTRVRYLERSAALAARERAGEATLKDRIDLSAYLIRLNKATEAIRVLAPVQEERNFMVKANLATAYQLTDLPDRAVFYQQQALDFWPKTWEELPATANGFNRLQLAWYRRAEKYHLALLQARLREKLQGGRPADDVDPLFPRLRLVGPSGRYEAGRVAVASLDELPADAVPLVTQLVLWLPYDDRLYWLLGELLNAHGNVPDAAAILDDVYRNRNYTGSAAVREHRKVLLEARPVAEALSGPRGGANGAMLLWEVAPRGFAGAAGAAAHEAQGLFFVSALYKAAQPPELVLPTTDDADKPPPTPAPPPWMPDWRQVGVSFAAGVLFTVFTGLQFREVRRRRSARPAGAEPPAESGSTVG